MTELIPILASLAVPSLAASGAVVKALRTGQHLSQSDLAKKMKYNDRTTIAKIESGANNLTNKNTEELAEVLGVTKAYLENALEKTLDSLNISIDYQGETVLLKDNVRPRSIIYPRETWERLKLENGLREVWEALENRRGIDKADSGYREISSDDLKRALWGKSNSMSDEDLNQVRQYARFLAAQKAVH